MSVNLFVYGVLMYEEALDLLTDRRFKMIPAKLKNYQRYNLVRDDVSKVPVVMPEIGQEVSGFVIYDVDKRSVEVLDHFEDADMGLYERIDAQAELDDSTSVPVGLYIGTPVANDFLSGIWSREEFEAENYKNMMEQTIPEFLIKRALNF